MHWQAFSFVSIVKSIFPEYFVRSSVVEFGSAYVNATIRELFLEPSVYYGLDLSKTIGVDIVYDGKRIYISDNLDVAISCECFEHNPHYRATFENMVNHVRQDGLVLFTCATEGRPEHGTKRTSPEQSPGTQSNGIDYYKNLKASDFDMGFINENFAVSRFFVNESSQDLYFIGIKKSPSSTERKKELQDKIYSIYEHHSTTKQLSHIIELLWTDNSIENCERFYELLISLPRDTLTPFNFQYTIERVVNGLNEVSLANLINVINEKLIQHDNLHFLHKPLYLIHRKLNNDLLANYHALKLFANDAKDEYLLYAFESLLKLGAKSQAENLLIDYSFLIADTTAQWVSQNLEMKIKRERLDSLLKFLK